MALKKNRAGKVDYDDVEVLLVEDNPQDAEMTLRVFKKYNLLNKVHRVKDGVEALDFLSSRGPLPKVLLLNYKMARMDGVDVIRELKKNERTRVLPVVLMLSSDQERETAESYGLGVNGYIVKPLDFSEFTRVVAQIGLYWLLVERGM